MRIIKKLIEEIEFRSEGFLGGALAVGFIVAILTMGNLPLIIAGAIIGGIIGGAVSDIQQIIINNTTHKRYIEETKKQPSLRFSLSTEIPQVILSSPSKQIFRFNSRLNQSDIELIREYHEHLQLFSIEKRFAQKSITNFISNMIEALESNEIFKTRKLVFIQGILKLAKQSKSQDGIIFLDKDKVQKLLDMLCNMNNATNYQEPELIDESSRDRRFQFYRDNTRLQNGSPETARGVLKSWQEVNTKIIGQFQLSIYDVEQLEKLETDIKHIIVDGIRDRNKTVKSKERIYEYIFEEIDNMGIRIIEVQLGMNMPSRIAVEYNPK